MTIEPRQTTDKDSEHLRLLSICHYVYSGLNALGLFGLFVHYLVLRTALTTAPETTESSPFEMISVIRGFYALAAILMITLAAANFFAGRFLTRTRNRMFLFVIAVVNCLNVPLGTTLGIFTIIVMLRPSVIDRFQSDRLY